MPSRHRSLAADWHATDCDCPSCAPHVPSVPRLATSAEEASVGILLGVPVGAALCWVAKVVTNGPGLGVWFGW